MKRHFLLLAMLCPAICSLAQTDSTGKSAAHGATDDTLHVGSLLIVTDGTQGEDSVHFHHHRHQHHGWHESKNINWLVLDLGLSNFTDKTDYGSAAAQQFAPGANADWFHLRTIKSVNVNIWLFMQRVNLIRHVVNLKYGLGIELNNYRYTENIKYLTNPTRVIMDTISYNKNKLAADYFTVPFMLNFNFMPNRRDGLGLSIGASAGYKYSSRQKLRNDQTGKHKTFDDFDMEPVKISWIGELGLGPVRLYGSYATKSMFKKGLDQTPYTLGLRFSNW
jgi:hypothetical protein